MAFILVLDFETQANQVAAADGRRPYAHHAQRYPARVREFDRIGQQVQQDLPQSLLVHAHSARQIRRSLVIEGQALVFRLDLDRVAHDLHENSEVDLSRI